MDYVAICLKGLEEIAEKETKGKKILPGRILFKKILGKISSKNEKSLKGKTKAKKNSINFGSVNIVYKLIKRFEFKEQEEILEQFKKLKIKVKKKFRVDCHRDGTHSFKSVEIEKLIGVYLQKKNLELDFKEPETVIFVDIYENNCLIGLLEKDELQKRDYRVKLNPDTINPCIAFSALSLIKYKKGDILVDPICRDGIITIEAALMKKGKVFGLDKNIRNARINSKIAKVEINLSQNEIDWLDTKFKKNSCKIVSYLPSVSKRHSESDVRRLYSELFHQFNYIAKDYIGLIVRKKDLINSYLNDFKITYETEIGIGDDKFNIVILKKNI